MRTVDVLYNAARVAVIFLALLVAGQRAFAQSPNIVVIMADDLGYGDIGFNGCADIPTPNIDSLAAQGVVFSSGYVSHSYCAPTRAGMLTGRYQQRFGFEANPDNSVVDVLPSNQITLGNVLTNVGYKTIAVGKWHLGGNAPNQPPNRGFTDFFGFLGGGNPYFPTTMRRDMTTVVETNYTTTAFTREAISYITTNATAGKPFFLYLAYNAPHQVLDAPQEYLDRFTNILDSTRQVYAAVVSAMDDGIGEVLQSLQDNGIATNTLIFFLSDNGGPTDVTSADNTPLRGFKGNIFEGGVHVPFAVAWPGRIPAGLTYTNPVISLDIFGTAVHAAGGSIPTDRPMDTVNLLPYLLGETNGIPHEQLYWRQDGGGKWAIREGSWKWENNPTNEGPLLVQLAADGTGEFDNLYTNDPARAAAMEQTFAAWDAQMLEPLFSDGQINEIGGIVANADNLGYYIFSTNGAAGYALTSPRYPPVTTSNFLIRFRMAMVPTPGISTNGYIVLGESDSTNSLVRAGVAFNPARLVITEHETGSSTEKTLAPADVPSGTNEYVIAFDKAANSLTLSVGTASVSRVLSRVYGTFTNPGYSISNAITRFSVMEFSHSSAESLTATFEWDAGAVSDRNWSNGTNWTGGIEPTGTNSAYINGGFTAVVAQAGERALNVYVGSTNQPSNGANSTGNVAQSGGSLIVGNSLYIGKYAGGAGQYSMSGGSLAVTGSLFVGDQGLGTMFISNSAAVQAADIVIGNAGDGPEVPGSRLTMAGGTLGAYGFFYVAGNNITNAGADGRYEQSGGAATVAVTVRVANNQDSTGTIAVAGGSFDVLLNLQVGNYLNSRGAMNVSGVSTVRVSGTTTLGKNLGSVGQFSVSGGLFAVTGNIEIGEANTSTGSLTVAGGNVEAGDIVAGRQGSGLLDINAGSVTGSTLSLSYAPNGIGTAHLKGGRLVLTNAGENLSLRRPGATMSVTDGTLVANGIAVGSTVGHNSATESAVMNISGGTVIGGFNNSASIDNDFYVGSGAGRTGVVNITSGTLDLSRSNNDLIIGRGTNALGIFTMDGGTVIVGGAMRVGALIIADTELTGNGQIYITNGHLKIGGTLQLPIAAGGTAYVSQVGGTVDVGGVNVAVGGGGGDGYYRISGGTLTNAGSLTIGHASNGSGTFNVVGGSASIRVGALSIATQGVLRSTFSGSAITPILAAGSIAAGGTLNVDNTGSYEDGTYLIATSLSETAVSGTFGATNWLNGVTGAVSYADNRIALTFDLSPELVGVPSDTSAECDDIPPAPVVTALNGCGDASDVMFNESTNAGSCAGSYNLIRVWSVTNTCGFGATATQIVSVADTTIPDLTCPADTNVLCEAEADPSMTGYATAIDNCDASPIVTYADATGTGVILRTWRAVDMCSNVATCVQTISFSTGGTDTDGDGISDYDECVSGTSPSDSNSYLRLSISQWPSGATLSFTTRVTHAYTIEYKADLTDSTEWPALTNVPGTGGEMTISDPAIPEMRSYRLKANRE